MIHCDRPNQLLPTCQATRSVWSGALVTYLKNMQYTAMFENNIYHVIGAMLYINVSMSAYKLMDQYLLCHM